MEDFGLGDISQDESNVEPTFELHGTDDNISKSKKVFTVMSSVLNTSQGSQCPWHLEDVDE